MEAVVTKDLVVALELFHLGAEEVEVVPVEHYRPHGQAKRHGQAQEREGRPGSHGITSGGVSG